ncbi:hypothetical protein GB937_009984 [Aspergillus fischeri]|nr:hypothetical protein GB937_009984 [Aspergillus fischeri]
MIGSSILLESATTMGVASSFKAHRNSKEDRYLSANPSSFATYPVEIQGSKPLISGRLHMYKNERHNAATPKIVVAESALQGREGQSPVALRSVERDMVYSSTEKNPWTKVDKQQMQREQKTAALDNANKGQRKIEEQ